MDIEETEEEDNHEAQVNNNNLSAERFRDKIANDMWIDYLNYLKYHK
jgi:hypothetical protein